MGAELELVYVPVEGLDEFGVRGDVPGVLRGAVLERALLGRLAGVRPGPTRVLVRAGEEKASPASLREGAVLEPEVARLGRSQAGEVEAGEEAFQRRVTVGRPSAARAPVAG